MSRLKFAFGVLGLLALALFAYFVLRSDYALLVHPKGTIARSQLQLIITNIVLMLIVIVPTFIGLFIAVRRAKKASTISERKWPQALLWILPTVIIAPMAYITWNATHALDPYQPLNIPVKPLTIQVVALDWKWLFIYPEQGIASVNFVQFPAETPIHFLLSADGSPMNSFWIPQLCGQIYSMTGMITPLHMMADGPGEYSGRAAEINGKGFADMLFVAKSSTREEFEEWVKSVQQSPLQLSEKNYNALVVPSVNNPITYYSDVEGDLFQKVVMKYLSPQGAE